MVVSFNDISKSWRRQTFSPLGLRHACTIQKSMLRSRVMICKWSWSSKHRSGVEIILWGPWALKVGYKCLDSKLNSDFQTCDSVKLEEYIIPSHPKTIHLYNGDFYLYMNETCSILPLLHIKQSIKFIKQVKWPLDFLFYFVLVCYLDTMAFDEQRRIGDFS